MWGEINQMIKYIAILMFLVGCVVEPTYQTIQIDSRLQTDSNGFYHLSLNQFRTQTIHRISGMVYENGYPSENIRVRWYASHYWLLSDSVGYIIDHWKFDDKTREHREAVYMGRDTVFITYFQGMEVPTVNGVSYSNAIGEVNTVFAPVHWMVGDTVSIIAVVRDDTDKIKIVLH